LTLKRVGPNINRSSFKKGGKNMAPTDPGVPYNDWGDSETTSADKHAMILLVGIVLFGFIMILIALCT